MAAKPAIEVTGTRELNRALKRAADRADALKEIHQRLAAPLTALARMEAPTQSGRLAGTVRASATKRALSLKAGRQSVPYAGPIEYGWRARNIDPNPFLERARDATADQVLEGYRRHIDQLIDDITRESVSRP